MYKHFGKLIFFASKLSDFLAHFFPITKKNSTFARNLRMDANHLIDFKSLNLES